MISKEDAAHLASKEPNGAFGVIESLLMLVLLAIFTCVLAALVLDASESAEPGKSGQATINGQ